MLGCLLRVLLVLGLIVAAGRVVLDFSPSFSPFWGEDLQWEYPSPDRRYVASTFLGSNGALGDQTEHMHLTVNFLPLKKNYSSWDAPHLVAVGRSLSATWKGPRHLVVTGCEWKDRTPTSWFDVRISYE